MSKYEKLAAAFNKTPAHDSGTLYVLAQDAIVALGKTEAQLDRANEKMAAFRQALDAEGVRVDELKAELDRKPDDPRADEPSESLMDAARRAVASQESAAPEPEDWPQRLAESIVADAALDETTVAYYPQEPRPMSEAPRDGTWISASIDVAFIQGEWGDSGGNSIDIDRCNDWQSAFSSTTAAGGSEWQEHGEGWSDEAILAGGSGEES